MRNLFLVIIILTALNSCKKEKDPPKPDPEPTPDTTAFISIDKTKTYQELIGFGGALTWYSDRIISSPKKDEITDLLFKDLGADIIRLKNWYYPVNYPVNKATNTMEPSWFKSHFDAANQLFTIAKAKDPNIKVLLSSWSPPAALKSNGQLNTGTLKKNASGAFMYDEFAQYWKDILDNIGFNPDYISIQNEPSYVNTGWETCEWRDTEAPNFGGFDKAFDAVYNKLKDRPNLPMLIAPESPNISFAANGTSFHEFSNAIKNRPYLGMYAWHPYNFSKGTNVTTTLSLLQRIKNEFGDKPNMMTEFSNAFGWFDTGRFINYSLVQANASGYIYWEMMWNEDVTNNAMIRVSGNGTYEVTPYYQLMKHFSKNIDRGYKRVETTASVTEMESSAYISPDGKKLTLLILNPKNESIEILVKSPGFSATKMDVWQSREGGNMYTASVGLSPTTKLTMPYKSITTVVLTL